MALGREEASSVPQREQRMRTPSAAVVALCNRSQLGQATRDAGERVIATRYLETSSPSNIPTSHPFWGVSPLNSSEAEGALLHRLADTVIDIFEPDDVIFT